MRLTACVLFLAACGSKDESGETDTVDTTGTPGTTDTTGTPGTTGGTGFAPDSGSWTYTQTSVDDDDCNIAGQMSISTFGITGDGNGSFTVDDGTYVFNCELSGQDFTCADRFGGETTMGAMGLSFLISGEAHGTFSSVDAATGAESADADCAPNDSQCMDAAAMFGINLPCHVAVSYTIAL